VKQCILFNVFQRVSSQLGHNEDSVCMSSIADSLNDFLRSKLAASVKLASSLPLATITT